MLNLGMIADSVGGTGVLITIIVVIIIIAFGAYMYLNKEGFSILTKKQKNMWVEASPFIGSQAIATDPFDPTSKPLPAMPVPKDTFDPVGIPLKSMPVPKDTFSPVKSSNWVSPIPGYKVTAKGLVRDSFSDIPGFVITAQGLKPEKFAGIPGYKLTAQGLKPEDFAGIPGFKVTAQGLKPEKFAGIPGYQVTAQGLKPKVEGWQPSYENQYDECDVTGGCPNVMLFLDQAYNRTYAAAGKDESGHLFYEFYGPGRAFARAKYKKAFPECPLPESISY